MLHIYRLRPALSALLVLGVLFALPACDSSDPEPEPEPEFSPTFSIASVGVPLQGGVAGLQFSFIPSVNVEITEVLITNPRAQTERFNGNNNVFLSGTSYDLQDPSEGFTRVSGTWRFQFNGRDANDATRSFNVTTTEGVGAFAPDAPAE